MSDRVFRFVRWPAATLSFVLATAFAIAYLVAHDAHSWDEKVKSAPPTNVEIKSSPPIETGSLVSAELHSISGSPRTIPRIP